MTIQRIAHIFDPPQHKRFTLLYGIGTGDIFINSQGQTRQFAEALYEALRQQGYGQVAFFSLARSLFFFDQASARYARGLGEACGDVSMLPRSTCLSTTGPLPGQLGLPSRATADYVSPSAGMGDLHALRVIDALLCKASAHANQAVTAPNSTTAIVFLQAETTLDYFDDRRTLAALLGEWRHLPPENPNSLFFVFAAPHRQELRDWSLRSSFPELKAMIPDLGAGLSANPDCRLVEISGPDSQEICRLVESARQQFGFMVLPGELESLCEQLAAENRLARNWLERFKACQMLSLETARKMGWFCAVRSSERDAWQDLEALVGLENIKKRVRQLAAWLRLRQARPPYDLRPEDTPSLHMLFVGNPGTGKTTVARLLGEIFHNLGLLRRGHLVEVSGADLIADHVGGSALKTQRVIDQALDGILFIDEAYVLTERARGGFGLEALDTILQRMETDRQRLVIIAAGYPERMAAFRRANPGLPRRFSSENILFFEDYCLEELWLILRGFLEARRIPLIPQVIPVLRRALDELYRRRDATFGNAGEMRNLADALDLRRADRLERLNLPWDAPLQMEDLPESYALETPLILDRPLNPFLAGDDNRSGQTAGMAQADRPIAQLEFVSHRLRPAM